jgi:hypothetical protein
VVVLVVLVVHSAKVQMLVMIQVLSAGLAAAAAVGMVELQDILMAQVLVDHHIQMDKEIIPQLQLKQVLVFGPITAK